MKKGSLFFPLMFAVAVAGISGAGEKAGTGSITGKIVFSDGAPMSQGKMVFFKVGTGPPPFPSRYFRPPDEMADIDRNGMFKANLPGGRYYVTAISKTTDDLIGPPVEGDFVFPGPTDLQSGKRVYQVTPGETTDIGTGEAIPYTRSSLVFDDNVTAIEGTVTDSDGKPVLRAMVFAFSSPNAVGKPLFISERTGIDGKYLLRVREGGTYYVRTRTSLKGGHPEEEEVLGFYGADKPSPVEVRTGETIKGIDIHGRVFKNDRKAAPGNGKRVGVPPRE